MTPYFGVTDSILPPRTVVREDLLVPRHRLPALLVGALPPKVEAVRVQKLAEALRVLWV